MNSPAPKRWSPAWLYVTSEVERVRVDAVERQAVGPEGEQRPWMDNVIVLRRRLTH